MSVREEDTICFKVNRCIDDLARLLRTNEIDPAEFGNRLHLIRKDAQKMENAIKLRKQVMSSVAGLEDEYQIKKGGRNKLKKTNKIANADMTSDKPRTYEFTMKENGKILYQQDVHGGVLSIVEEIEDIDDNGALTGVAQSFFFGHPLVLWFGYDQLTKSMEGKRMEIMGEFRKGIESRQFADPLVKARLIAVANHSLKNDK